MRKMLIAGNWKMHGLRSTVDSLVQGLLSQVDSTLAQWAVFPPYPYLAYVNSLLDNAPIALGAQSVSQHPQGAFTGEVSLDMLQDCGCEFVIVGHSERRGLFHESNQAIADKFHAALLAGIKPILCLGETIEQRKAGKTLEIVQEQLAVALRLHDNPHALKGAVIAYEPVWAIGTGLTATPEQAQQVHQAIRAQLAELDAGLASDMRILYGGSVKPDNAASLFAMPDIDGALVGGASLDAEKFIAIGKACNR